MKHLLIVLCTALFANGQLQGEVSVNPNFRRLEVPADKITTSRSLQEIFAQHGVTSQSGNYIITADGILEDDTPASKKLVTLQHRATLLKLAKNGEMFVKTMHKTNPANGQLLISYVQQAYGQERSPFFAFVADLVHEHNEINLINTEALKLTGEELCKKGAQELLNNMCQYKGFLNFFDACLERLWEEMIYFLPQA